MNHTYVFSWAKLLSGLLVTYPNERYERIPGRQIIYYTVSPFYKKILCTELLKNKNKLILEPTFKNNVILTLIPIWVQ